MISPLLLPCIAALPLLVFPVDPVLPRDAGTRTSAIPIPVAATGSLLRDDAPRPVASQEGAVPVAARPDSAMGHLILISIDGLRPEFYRDPLWPAPTLRRLAAEGVSADRADPPFPSYTFPGHTTLLTGALPARHGVLHNREIVGDSLSAAWVWSHASIRVPTLWDGVRAAGGTTASIAWPVSLGAPIDWNLPAIWDVTGTEPWSAVIRRAAVPDGLVDELEREAVGHLPPDALAGIRLSQEDRVAAMADHILRRYRPNLFTIHLVLTDSRQHLLGPERSTGLEEALGAVDRAVNRILEGVAEAGLRGETAVIIVGDHGFTKVDTHLAPNVWLAEWGLRGSDDGPRTRFVEAGGAAFLRTSAEGAVREELGRTIRTRLADREEVRAGAVRIVDREELDRLGADPAALLALAAAPGFAFIGATTGPSSRPSSQPGGHGHHPETPGIETGFIAWGTGIRGGETIPFLHLADIAPLAAALLSIPFDAPDGALPDGVLLPDPEFQRR